MIDARTSVLLDNPVWSALTLGNSDLAEGGPLARRYPPDVSPFAAVAERSPAAFDALALLVPPAGRVALTSTDALVPAAGLVIDMQAPLVQMVLGTPVAEPRAGPTPDSLGATDVGDMLDLAGRTQPGSFGRRTIDFGGYIGLRVEGALAAMAGERMRFDRFVEVSAVCVDPDHRGKGYAGLLVTAVAQRIQAQGLTPFLHVFESNAGAVALYEKHGFAIRRRLYVTSLAHPPPMPRP